MQILQVKQYHEQVAGKKYWQGHRCNPRTMFYFMLEDRKGYPTKDRVKGYIAFDNCKAVFAMSRELAIKKFNS